MNDSPRSAYIHVPFCSHRCGYCNFTLVAGRDDLMEAFLEALELEITRELGQPREVTTLFLGGGTPTHLPPALLEQMLELLLRWLKPTTDCEFTCEANPLDCTPRQLEILRSAGVNRLSLGGQSFSNRKLRALERDHSGEQLHAILEDCREFFDNVSLDLIFAAPEESLTEWRQDIRLALATGIQHLSTYGLTIERGSAFYGRTLRNSLTEIDSDLQLRMYEHAIDELQAAGWEHYEVSSFARHGRRCRHNQAYWLGEPWYAFGPGAASFQQAADGRMVRAVNHQSPTTYIRRVLAGSSPIQESEVLSLEQRVRERLVFGLRQLDGVELAELDTLLSGQARTLFEPQLSEFVAHGWLAWQDERLCLTRRGLMISDGLWPELLSSRQA